MIPLIPALVLVFLSLLATAFIILKIVTPILPPSPLSRRVSPSEFGLPAFRSLTAADKCHLWLAGADFLSLVVFVWHIVSEATGSYAIEVASDPLAASRLWLYMTTRQTCLCVVAFLVLVHVRFGRSLSLGNAHWRIWAPVIILTATSTALAAVMSGTEVKRLFRGLAIYSGVSALLATFIFAGLFLTLHVIKNNLAILHKEGSERWAKGVEQGRTSLATEELEAIKDGASWFTSVPASTRTSVSSWSFSTRQTAVGSTRSNGRPQNTQLNSVATKSSLGFSSPTHDKVVPQVPPIPSSYATSTLGSDPFRRSLPPLPHHPRGRFDSHCSWLTSTDGSHTTLPAWSFPPSQSGSVCSSAIHSHATAKVLGGNTFDRQDTSHGSLKSLAAPEGAGINILPRNIISWAIYIWAPMVLSLPYLVILTVHRTTPTAVYVLYFLSVTISSPLLALNLLFKSPLPVPTGLFDRADRAHKNKTVLDRVSAAPSEHRASQSRRSGTWQSMSSSPTVVEGCRSGDVWLKNGDAVAGKGKLSRAISMLAPKPQMSVIPPGPPKEESLPPTPACVPGDSLKTIVVTTYSPAHSQTSAEFGRLRSSSKSRGSRSSFTEEGQPTKIMVAQRHYSALAQTIAVPPGTISEKQEHEVVNASGAVVHEATTHLRTRSTTTTSFSGPESPDVSDISLPPPFPLPPTPPSVRAARRLQSSDRSSFSSGYSFGPIESVNEIDELSAGVLPLLVPGLKIGDDVKITRASSPLGSRNKSMGDMATIKAVRPFNEDSSSPEFYSTPANNRFSAPQKREYHPNHRRSLANLGLGKEGYSSCSSGGCVSDVHRPSSILPPSSESPFEEFEAGLRQNPHSHSTPQLTRPPIPLTRKAGKPTSIVYIRSENIPTSTVPAAAAPRPSRDPLVQRSAHSGRSLIPKASLTKLKANSDGSENREPVSDKGRGLRPLKLLQDQDTNSVKSTSSRESGEFNEGIDGNRCFRPLTLGKRQKTEVLPRLVIRPPSTVYDAY